MRTIRWSSDGRLRWFLAAALGALLLWSGTGVEAKKRRKKVTLDYDSAVEMLHSPSTWCRGAEALARLGERRALVPLARALESRAEGGKACLMDALRALDAGAAAAELFASRDADERRIALVLMGYFRDDGHLPLLLAGLKDADARVRAQARESLFLQQQGPRWEDAVLPLLDAEDGKLRAAAAAALALNPSGKRRASVAARLARETDPQVKEKLQAALGKMR